MTFQNETTDFLDRTEWIERYAWFGYFVSTFNSLLFFKF